VNLLEAYLRHFQPILASRSLPFFDFIVGPPHLAFSFWFFLIRIQLSWLTVYIWFLFSVFFFKCFSFISYSFYISYHQFYAFLHLPRRSIARCRTQPGGSPSSTKTALATWSGSYWRRPVLMSWMSWFLVYLDMFGCLVYMYIYILCTYIYIMCIYIVYNYMYNICLIYNYDGSYTFYYILVHSRHLIHLIWQDIKEQTHIWYICHNDI